jgi:hypothetical protein
MCAPYETHIDQIIQRRENLLNLFEVAADGRARPTCLIRIVSALPGLCSGFDGALSTLASSTLAYRVNGTRLPCLAFPPGAARMNDQIFRSESEAALDSLERLPRTGHRTGSDAARLINTE